jgi:predicted  nucleic acid-binding Zn-ribbon protein
MAKALKPIVVVLLLLCIASLVLGIQLFGKREVLKGRVQKNEQALGAIAKNIHFDAFSVSSLAAEDEAGLTLIQAPLNQLAAAAQVQYDDLQNTKQDLESTRQDLSVTKDELARTQSDLDRATAQIETLNQSITEKNDQIAKQETRIDGLEQEKVNQQIQIDDLNNQIVSIEDELRDSQDKVLALEQTVNQLETELGYGKTRVLPKGLTGRILFVNKDWNFVVIDLGSDDGLVPNAEMLIHRKDELVGKVTISGISRKMAIAELQPEWAQSSVKEGDFVVF